MLAQIARDGLVRDLAARLTSDFARNLDRHLSGVGQDGAAEGSQDLNGLSLLMNLLRTRARKAMRRGLGGYRWGGLGPFLLVFFYPRNFLKRQGRHDEFRAPGTTLHH